ncbi:redoxin domain-containing protein [Reichenbachiella ulvae]|uniref:Redoxin domain-containing protein n=1 Tax=Reichenbachiella ulvae TaxID=2980104 RepID=A0ABT3CXU5_9BACT|nr:redoxin domain-containing protein [Reichenbachiella ulvae]MCV9388432.1 redoxin domain-containing protein [Reichenbachiella ulvae]
MKLSAGQQAPSFSTSDIHGNPVELKSYAGKKVLLSFFRDVSCPFCNLRIRELMKHKEEWEAKGLHMIFFLDSTAEEIKASPFHNKLDGLPVIGDQSFEVYSIYGVEKSLGKMIKTFTRQGSISALKEGGKIEGGKSAKASMNLIPADFFIDEDQKIVVANYGQHIRDHIKVEEIEKFANQVLA